MSVLYRKSK